MIKRIFKTASVFFFPFALLCACADHLDFPPEGVVPSEQFFQTPEQAEQSVVAIYAHMRSWTMAGFPFIIMKEIQSDNSVKGSAVGDASFINDFDRFTFTSNQFILNDYWGGRYQGI